MTEETDVLQSMGSYRVRHDLATERQQLGSSHTCMSLWLVTGQLLQSFVDVMFPRCWFFFFFFLKFYTKSCTAVFAFSIALISLSL